MNRIARFLKDVLESPSTQPLMTLWILGGLTVSALLAGWINLPVALLISIGLLIVLVLSAFRKDLALVHDLVNSTNDRMVNRITQLTKALEHSDVAVPPEPHAGEDDG